MTLTSNSSFEEVAQWLQENQFDFGHFVNWKGSTLFGADKDTLVGKLGVDEGERLHAEINFIRNSISGK